MSEISFVCPSCRSRLEPTVEYVCSGCGRRYPIVDGVAVLVAGMTEESGLQAAFFDSETDSEFEIERPTGAPPFYGWLLGQKFRRAVRAVPLDGESVLVVCGGSGMDAEFLANAGAKVVSSDISIGAARRARDRARRHGLSFESIVADVERLPFGDSAFDVVYVHDGLHHIERPLVGLTEMARVARQAVCVTEPADAFATAIAVRIGLALEREEAGNRVARLHLDELRTVLETEGFSVRRADRYAMFYRHEPGPAMRVCSRSVVLPLARYSFRAVNALLGRWGNKLVVQAVRA